MASDYRLKGVDVEFLGIYEVFNYDVLGWKGSGIFKSYFIGNIVADEIGADAVAFEAGFIVGVHGIDDSLV